MTEKTTPLRLFAHGRAGDKDGALNISVIAFDESMFDHLCNEVTVPRVQKRFGQAARVRRYELPHIGALNFVIKGVLGGNVNDSLRLDKHGKSLSYVILDMPISPPTKKIAATPANKKCSPM